VTAAPLPPLPPAFGVEDHDVRPGGRNMLDLLVEDHHRLGQLVSRLAAAQDDRADPWGADPRDVEDVLVAALSRHLSAEEQYLHPTVRKVVPGGAPLADREVAADAGLLRAAQRLRHTRADDTAYPGVVEEVATYVREHVERTSHQVFPKLRAECSDTELIRLGNRVQIAQEAAPTRPHPGTPSTPPLNKIVDPAVGVVDKVRDALTRRTTWPEDL
jgi:hypothetical protein